MDLQRRFSNLFLTGAFCLASVFCLYPACAQADQNTDALLGKVFEEIENNRLDQALAQVEALLRAKPNFRLAYLIKGDLLLARGRALKTFGNAPNGSRERLDDLRAEAMVRLHAYRQRPPQDQVPRYLMQMRQDQRYAIVVDNKRSRLYLYQNENGRPRFVADYYISNASASDKATVAAQLFGRGYVSLIPILKLGSKGIAEAAHVRNFLDCMRSRQKPTADQETVGRESSLLSHLGNASWRAGKTLRFDYDAYRFTDEDANQFLTRAEYRKPWVLPKPSEV